jgi:hypothetical protein
MAGVISAGWGTGFNRPEEYGPHWDGFGKRYAMRFSGVATSNTMEAGLGSLWGEDPRYPRAGSGPLKGRVGQIVKMAFLARDRQGRTVPAYARYAAIPGSNFLANTWRVDSDANTKDAAVRTGFGFLARVASNAFTEFWPDVRAKFGKK